MTDALTQNQRAYDEYWRLVDLWRFYVKLMIEATTLFAAIAGGMLTYILTPGVGIEKAGAALFVPAGLGAGFAVISFWGIFQSLELAASLKALGSECGVRQVVHVRLLPAIVGMATIYYLATSIAYLCLALPS